MHHFHYKKNELYCEDVSLETIAQEVGTPCYVYSYATLLRHFRVFDEAFAGLDHLVCFAMKANSNIAILKSFIQQGAGLDIVSGGELFRGLVAGVDPKKVVYSGVGKTEEEMAYALKKGILQFNVESAEELRVLNRVAQSLGQKAPVSLRVNPNIDPKTHPYISTGLKKSKFGIPMAESLALYEESRKLTSISIQGVSCHIGSQITELKPFQEALAKVSGLVSHLRKRGFTIRRLDIGGGLGIPYKDEVPPEPRQYGKVLFSALKDLGCQVLFEPGRVLVGNAGILMTRVLYRKGSAKKRFVVVDGAMNDLIRPALYESFHQIWPVKKRRVKNEKVDVVGPICESGDFFATNRSLPVIQRGELLAVMSAGAYGFAMASNYNSRPKAAEVFVSGSEWHVIRKREEVKDLLHGEHIPKFLVS